jgi:hypothetical protein
MRATLIMISLFPNEDTRPELGENNLPNINNFYDPMRRLGGRHGLARYFLEKISNRVNAGHSEVMSKSGGT